MDFDDGFVPDEVGADGDWLVDNLGGAAAGEAAIHPPGLEGGESKSMTFDCGAAEHTQLSFVARNGAGGATLKLFDGKVLRGAIHPYSDTWTHLVIDVPRGKLGPAEVALVSALAYELSAEREGFDPCDRRRRQLKRHGSPRQNEIADAWADAPTFASL